MSSKSAHRAPSSDSVYQRCQAVLLTGAASFAARAAAKRWRKTSFSRLSILFSVRRPSSSAAFRLRDARAERRFLSRRFSFWDCALLPLFALPEDEADEVLERELLVVATTSSTADPKVIAVVMPALHARRASMRARLFRVALRT